MIMLDQWTLDQEVQLEYRIVRKDDGMPEFQARTMGRIDDEGWRRVDWEHHNFQNALLARILQLKEDK